jgi:hypothetical protein
MIRKVKILMREVTYSNHATALFGRRKMAKVAAQTKVTLSKVYQSGSSYIMTGVCAVLTSRSHRKRISSPVRMKNTEESSFSRDN